MKVLILILFVLASFRALAGYKCEVQLAKSNDLEKLLTQKTWVAQDHDFSSANINDFFKEEGLSLNILMSGWKGEEQASFTVTKENKPISEKSSLVGTDKKTIWFENFKLDIQCDLKA